MDRALLHPMVSREKWEVKRLPSDKVVFSFVALPKIAIALACVNLALR